MTNAPDTITLTVGTMAALIVRCAIELASLSIRQANQDAKAQSPKGWTPEEQAEVVAHAEKGQPQRRRSITRKEALKIASETLARAEQERIDVAVRDAGHAAK